MLTRFDIPIVHIGVVIATVMATLPHIASTSVVIVRLITCSRERIHTDSHQRAATLCVSA